MVAWNDRALLGEWRERWASLANERLLAAGHDVRIDHRSHAEQGIPLEPQHKIGPAGARREHRGEDAERAAEHQAIARRNGETIIAEPQVALDAITRQQSTFTRRDLARFVHRHTADREQFERAMARAEAAPELVRLGTDGRGRERFTTSEMLQVEQRMEGAAAAIAGQDTHRLSWFANWRLLQRAEAGGLVLGEEQRGALRHVVSGPDLALVVGYAGTGKSAMLGVARQAWEAAGYTVRGAALSGIAAEGLEGGSGIQSRTLASLEWAWKDGRDQLGPRDVLVVDEAGLVGSRQMERVLGHAREAGAKVVLVGDPEQLQAIEAGAAFRALAERHGAAEISAVRRQHTDWQRQATRELATERTSAALGRYEQAGMVHAAETREAARAALVAGWDAIRRHSPQASQVMLAYTRDDARALNELAREAMRASGALGVEQPVQTERGERAFAPGDRLMFLRNERGLGVKNGTLGTVLAVEAERLTVRLDGTDSQAVGRRDKAGTVVSFALRDYAHIDHGYAATIHKAQGVTVDQAHVLASGHMDRHAAYVALTRHRDGVALHYGRDEFADAGRLARTLGRERLKDTSLDYELTPEEGARRYAERRGLDPLRPESAIVVRASARAPERTPERPAEPPRRGRFAGLRLGSGPPQAPEPEPTRRERLDRGLAGYARAWSDAARMQEAGLPVLPHQEAALQRAGAVLEREGVNLARDASAALARHPGLAAAAGARQEGVDELRQAVGEERRGRLALEERGRAAMRAWDKLEEAHKAAEKAWDWQGKRETADRMMAFAEALKADKPLDALLRTRGRELGLTAGSGLEQVAQAREETEVQRVLGQELGLERSLSRGRSLGM